MTIHRYAAKRDKAEPPIVEALEKEGCTVLKLSGKGVPDLLVWVPPVYFGGHGTWVVGDAKTDKVKLTAAQQEWEKKFGPGVIHIWLTPEDALETIYKLP